MKVLLVVPGGVTVDGAGDVIPALAQYVAALAGRCHVAVIAVNDQPDPECEAGPQFTIIHPGRRRGRLLGPWREAGVARRLLKEEGIEFDLLHSFWLGRPSTVAWLLRNRFRRPWLASVAGQELRADRLAALPPVRRRLADAENRVALTCADRISAGSAQLVRAIASYGRSARWWPLFPDTARFQPEARDARTGDRFRIVTVADHNEAKDAPTLLATIRELALRGYDVVLDWVGRELTPGRSLSLANALGIADRVRIHGHVAYDDVVVYLRQADVYLQSSRFESQGVSVCEAAACGLPLVGTDTGILPELSSAGALVCGTGDPWALADAIASLIGDPARRAELGQGARRWIREYGLDWTVGQALAMYEDMLARSQ